MGGVGVGGEVLFCPEGFNYALDPGNVLKNWLSAADGERQEWHSLLEGPHKPRGGKLSV